MSHVGTHPPPNWSTLLVEAVQKPGVISDAYRRFWNYSVGNQLLALFQCLARDLKPGPINTFLAWRELGRHVRKGERALVLCVPVTVKNKARSKDEEKTAEDKDESFTRFVYRSHWFVLSQTEGKDYCPTELPAWSEDRALEALDISRIPFASMEGNAQGYANGRNVSISPIAFKPHRTLFHEIAHVVLGHTTEHETLVDGEEKTPRDIREVEAECVAPSPRPA